MKRGTKVRTHLYARDEALPAGLDGLGTCLCGLPERNARHQLPATSPAVKAAEARRYGERNNDE